MSASDSYEAIAEGQKSLLPVMKDLQTPMGNAGLFYAKLPEARREDPRALCMRCAILMSIDFYRTAATASLSKTPLAGGGAARTLIEIVADMYHVFHVPAKAEERAQKYVDSVGVFELALFEVVKDIDEGRPVHVKELNEWTTSKIQHRVAALGSGTEAAYDYLSYFTHANPMGIIHYENETVRDTLKVVVLSAAIQSMISLLHIIAIKEEKEGIVSLDVITALQTKLRLATPD
jgi:hypothetical protein